MKRRNLLKGVAAAGAMPMTGITLGSDVNALPASHEPVVVDGLIAGTIRESYFEGMKKGGVHCAVAGAPRDFQSFTNLLDFFDAHADELVHAKTVADIRRAWQEGKYANVFSWQYATALGTEFNAPPGTPGTALRGFQEVGLRITGLGYNMTHAFGGGNLGPHIPLTRAGRRLVEEIHKLNMVLDLGGHTGEQASLDAIAMAPEIPVICTRTNVATIADKARCVSDRLIDAIAGTGGVIGLSAVSDFHVHGKGNTGKVRRANLEDHVDQYDYIKRRVGVEHVGMGTDSVEGMPIPYARIDTDIIPEDMIDEPWRFIEGFEKIEQFPNLVAALRRRGWSPREIDLAMGENWLRVYEQVWGS
jgi:membrane dipeptidase